MNWDQMRRWTRAIEGGVYTLPRRCVIGLVGWFSVAVTASTLQSPNVLMSICAAVALSFIVGAAARRLAARAAIVTGPSLGWRGPEYWSRLGLASALIVWVYVGWNLPAFGVVGIEVFALGFLFTVVAILQPTSLDAVAQECCYGDGETDMREIERMVQVSAASNRRLRP